MPGGKEELIIRESNGTYVVLSDGTRELIATIPYVDTAVAGVTTFVTGMILPWSGAISAIPAGWVICDGSNGTPNLTARMILHADADSGGTWNVAETGGDEKDGVAVIAGTQYPLFYALAYIMFT